MKKFGIDISGFQNGIDFNKLKEEKVQFIMLRAGFTGSLNGVSKQVDSSFEKFYKKANKLNIPVGAYWFSRATSYEKGKEEAKYMYNHCLKNKKFLYPIAIDIEDPIYQAKASKKQVTNAIKGFCEYLEAKGCYVSIYANSNWFVNKMNLKDLKKYDKWLANWSKTNPKKPKHGMWQYGGSYNYIRSAIMAGYTIDQDYAYKDYPTLIKEKGLNGYNKVKKKEKNKNKNYTKGKYKTLDYMNVRVGPGTSYRQMLVKDLTKDGKKHVVNKEKNSNAVYKKNTEFTALKIIELKNEVWAKTPSGYVCIKNKNKVYCKKI